MGRARLVSAFALLAALLAACGSSPTPKFAPPPPSSSVPGDPSTTAAADPLPPVMPELAKEHTVAGARHFAEFLLATLNYSEATLDSAPLGPLFSPGCAGCAGVVAFVRGIKKERGTLVGGRISGNGFVVTPLSVGSHQLMAVSFRYHSTRQVVRIPGRTPKVYSDAAAPLTLVLSALGGGWLVTSWEAHR